MTTLGLILGIIALFIGTVCAIGLVLFTLVALIEITGATTYICKMRDMFTNTILRITKRIS